MSRSEASIEHVTPHVWRVALPVDTLPPFDHTNAYLVVHGGVALLVDPGSAEPAAVGVVQRAMEQAGARLLKGIVLTHTHHDHVDGVGPLRAAAAAGAAFGGGGPPAVYAHTLEAPLLPSAWDVVHLSDGRRLTVGDVTVRCLHTPGHSPGHLTLLVETDDGPPEMALAGDLVAAEGSVWVGVPDGDMQDYLRSLERIAAAQPARIGAGHGAVLTDPTTRLAELREHRLARERQVLDALADGPLGPAAITERIYPTVPEPVRELAEKSVLAHLVKLMRETKVVHLGDDQNGPYGLHR